MEQVRRRTALPDPPRRASVALLFLLAAASLLPGCGRTQTEGASKAAPATPPAKTTRTPQAIIFEDEAMPRGSEAIVGGKVENVSNAELKDVYVEMRLVPRGGGEAVIKEINLKPSSLAPGERGAYSITISNQEWGSAGVLSLKSRGPGGEIAFKSEPGAKRPPMRVAKETRTVVVPRAKSKGGDDFINTPDNPEVVR